ncbi:hypothetical protein GX48_04360 [Paracoccidioides brasiliensis]|nr:hypothetical protein GX48_04360 [Paracoccidioides brasiliensis]
MDFPAGALTNFRSICGQDGFCNIFWRIYSRVAAGPPTSQLNLRENPVLRSSNELRNSIILLRNLRCLVSPLANGSDLWIFSANPNFDALGPVYSNKGAGNDIIVAGSVTFQNSVSGSNSAAEIKHRLLSDPESSIFNEALQDKSMPISGELSKFQAYATYSAFFEAFISATSRALTLHFTQQQKVIPLGTRTLYSSLDENGYPRSSTHAPCTRNFTSFLSTLDINMTAKGKLIVSLSTLPQPGIEQLHLDSESDITAYLNNDLWLAPSGILCRLISIDGYQSNHSNIVSPENIGALPNDFERSIGKLDAMKQEWKRTVIEWLRKLGLNLKDPQTVLWVEVEVNVSDRPLYDTFSRFTGNRRKVSPFIQILWPSNLCFTRSRSNKTAPINPTEFFSSQAESPLQFAERWLNESFPEVQLLDEQKTDNPSEVDEKHLNYAELSPLDVDSSGIPESLARTVNIPDAQLASAVYPTPPGGALTHNLEAGMVVEGLGASTIEALNYPPSQGESIYNEHGGSTTYLHRNPDFLPAGLDTTSSELGVGSGLYDTAADEEFFGDIDGTNFDTKGITEADFNFFDEPDFAGLTGNLEMQTETPEILQANESTSAVPHTYMTKAGAGPSHSVQNRLSAIDDSDSRIRNPSISSPNTTTGESQRSQATELGQAAPMDGSSRRPISPPLSPIQIKEILSSNGFAHSELGLVNSKTHKFHPEQNQYKPVIFQLKLGSSDKKYKLDGRFWFGLGRRHTTFKMGGYPSDIPTIGFPDKERENNPKLSITITSPSPLVSDNALETKVQSPSASSSCSSDNGSITDHGSKASLRPNNPVSLKRKRDSEVEGNTSLSPLERRTLAPGTAKVQLNDQQLALLGILLSEAVDWPLTGYFSRKENVVFPAFSRREDLPQAAQLVVDQVTQSSLCHIRDDLYKLEGTDWDCVLSDSLFDNSDAIGHMSKLDLRTFATIEDGPNTRKDAPSIKSNISGSICKICPPHVKIHRGNGFLEVLPAAIGFWETFGLEPLQGKKNILPFCIYPPNITEAADSFMERLGLIYSSGNFGTHSRPSQSNGLIPWTLNAASDQDYASLMHALNISCENLGSALSNLSASDENVVIYIINPFVYEAAIVDICSAFIRLFHKYVGDVDRQHTRHLNELVLQIIPLEFIASPDTLIVPPQIDYLRLALEVYSRCPPKDRSSDWMGCAPPLVLADPIPKVVPFRLSSEPVAPLEEGKCLHVAYSQSVDQRWVTAAWTDSSGRYQTTLSYCLRERDSPVSRSISEIRTQIWETSKDIMDISSSYWRLMVVKDEPIGADEVDMWKSLLDQYNRDKSVKVELGILCVNIKPGLSLKLPTPPLQLSALSQQPTQAVPATTTPGSTPRPVPSPDPSGAAGTPPATHTTANTPMFTDSTHSHQQQQQLTQQVSQASLDSDQDTILIDKSDETWGVTLSHRLNNSYSLTKYQPALASGYLFRRSGTSDTDGLAVMSVNLIYTNSRRPTDHLLKDILRMYRELATLARTRGIIHVRGNYSLPWHIMTAIKGQEVLCYTL